MKKFCKYCTAIAFALTLTADRSARAEIVEESGSLLEFFAGNEENCAYDNWLSHVSEGIVRAGYNDYGPAELDRQTNGFGDYLLIDSLENPDEALQRWYRIFANIVAGNLEDADAILDSTAFAGRFDIVRLDDGDRRYAMVRETLDSAYFDDNGTETETDDVRGSFRYGWGIYIFNLNPLTPQLVYQVPHPCDDFIAPYIAIEAFISAGASALFVNGAGREVKWTQVGEYDNSKSRSDPTRVINRSVFHEAHKAVVDSIGDEFIVPIHSYDSRGRNLAQCLLSTYTDNNPDPPLIDRVNRFDILHLTPVFPVQANTIGNAEHPAVRIDDFYAIWNDGPAVLYNFQFSITNYMPGLYGWLSPQRSYSWDRRDTLTNRENYMHIEHDEMPDVITEAILDFYPAEGVPTYETYRNANEFYRPLYNAITDFYHRPRSRTVPTGYATIQGAIEDSYGGDTILVEPGVYVENINFRRKNLYITSRFMESSDPAFIDSTVISGNPNGGIVTFAGGEIETARLSGFTILGGRSLDGAGIFILSSRPTIDHCIITGNVATGFGGAIFCGNAQPTILNCTITGNSAAEGGGAIFGWNQSQITLMNSIITGNQPEQVRFLRLGTGNRLTCSYSDLEGGAGGIMTGNNAQITWGEGNLNVDPLFLDPEAGIFRLSPYSLCVNSGSPSSPPDPDSTRADMGALAIEFKNILIDRQRLDFGNLEPGLRDSIELTLFNAGQDTISILSLAFDPRDAPFEIVSADTVLTIEPRTPLRFTVYYAPEGNGDYRATLVIETNHEREARLEVALNGTSLGVDLETGVDPEDYTLYPLFPNPFNGQVSLHYFLPRLDDAALAVYDVSGRRVQLLAHGRMASGHHTFTWSADGVSSGIYFVSFEAGDRRFLRKLTLIR